ncbi:MAG: hypothetical protein R6U92_05920 [Bacillota bacterium]
MTVPPFVVPKDRVIILSSGAQDRISLTDAVTAVLRHLNADWGQVNDSDRMMNDFNLARKGMLFSEYLTDDDTRFWVITESGHKRTMVMLPREYGKDDVDDRTGYILHGVMRRDDGCTG